MAEPSAFHSQQESDLWSIWCEVIARNRQRFGLKLRLIPKLIAASLGGDELRCYALQVDAVFTHRHMAGQMHFMHAAKRS